MEKYTIKFIETNESQDILLNHAHLLVSVTWRFPKILCASYFPLILNVPYDCPTVRDFMGISFLYIKREKNIFQQGSFDC